MTKIIILGAILYLGIGFIVDVTYEVLVHDYYPRQYPIHRDERALNVFLWPIVILVFVLVIPVRLGNNFIVACTNGFLEWKEERLRDEDAKSGKTEIR